MKSKRGNISPYHSPDRESGNLADIIRIVDQYAAPSNITPPEAWNRIEKQLHLEGSHEKREMKIFRNPGQNASQPVRTIFARVAVASAVLCFLVTGYLMFYQFSTTVRESEYGERLFVQLPDGSDVTLNAGSKITYRTFGWNRDREVSLEGEAFFEVTKGNSFTVVADNFRTRVLGTSFNVYSRSHEFRVNCSSGKIEVTTESGQQVILEPGDYLVGSRNSIRHLGKTVYNRADSWIRGEFYFHDEPLTNVFSEIERQFNITIKYGAIETRRYSGYFNDRDLDSALNLVCIPMQLNYKYINERQIVIF